MLKLFELGRNLNPLSVSILLFFVTIACRLPFTSKFLYHMDSGHFALALKNYDITVHQPHPPGYFLYVMLGKLLNFIMTDANLIFVSISVFFSALTVVAVFLLGREMFDHKTGLLASVFAITSPSLWFHGEVALSYSVEAFFSTFVAYCCWKLFKGEHSYLWLSVIALGVAGGIRQNTAVFLFPMWLISVKQLPIRKSTMALLLLFLVSLCWFIPMVVMTGGWSAYDGAFKELWLFNTGHNTFFDKGVAALRYYARILFVFTIWGLGSGTFVLALTAYSMIRHRQLGYLDRNKCVFFLSWIAPSVLFYLFVFIHPANPGYVLIFLPPLILLVSSSIFYIFDFVSLKKAYLTAIIAVLVIFNLWIFFLTNCPVSYNEIRKTDREMAIVIKALQEFDPENTAVLVRPYVCLGYRQIMYYVPQFHVYLVDLRVASNGQVRKTFWGVNRETFLMSSFSLPQKLTHFVNVSVDSTKELQLTNAISIKELAPGINFLYGPCEQVTQVLPELKEHK